MTADTRMGRFATWIAAPRVQMRVNAIATVVWFVMMPVTLAIPIFRTSILWLAFISAWALFATHLGAWVAALAYVRAESADRKADHVIIHSEDIPDFHQ
jgi:hypothetical protein